MRSPGRPAIKIFYISPILASVFNTSLGTWRMLMHEKPRLIPILREYPITLKGTGYVSCGHQGE